DYNEDDGRATLALRDWLAAKHPDDAPWAEPRERKIEEAPPEDGERAELRRRLTEGAEPGSPRWLAGELLQYHRREARPAWWWFFERRDQMTLEDLVDDAEAIGGITPIGDPVRDKQSFVQTFAFPAQEHKLRPGDQVTDPATKKSAGTIIKIDSVTGTLDLRRGPKLQGIALPRALIPSGPFRTNEQRAALARFGSSMLAGDGRYPALRDILGRTPPRIRGRALGDSIQTI